MSTTTPSADPSRSRSRRRRRRVAAASISVCVVAAVTVGALTLATRSHGPERVRPGHASSSQRAGMVTSDQLRAHLGVGAPAGWAPVDLGDARVYVPANWIREDVTSCTGGPDPMPGMVSVGKLAQAGCLSTGQWPLPPEAVSLVPSTTAPTVSPVRVVHEYRIYMAGFESPVWTMYDVPQLGVRIALHGTLGEQVLDTLAPSARKVALEYARQRVPDGNRVSTDGLRLTLPRAWTVGTVDALPCDWADLPDGRAQLLRIPPDAMPASCPAPQVSATNVHDGMRLYLPPAPTWLAGLRGRVPLAVVSHRDTTIRVFADDSDSTAVQLVVQRNGSRHEHVAELALGRDGRVAGGVLASIDVES